MSGRKSNNLSKTLTYIVIFLLLIAVIGTVAYFTQGFKSDFSTFYITYNNKDIMDKAQYALPSGEHRFDIKYTLGFLQSDTKQYSVKVVPSGKAFDFAVDGVLKLYTAEKDLTPAFDIELYEDYFTLKIPDNISMTKILQRVYPDSEVSIVSEIDPEEMYFVLCISSYNNTSTVYIYFSIPLTKEPPVTIIILDPNHIVFN